MIHDKLILITGGSSGIGRQLALDLLRLGNRVAVASNNSEDLDRTITELSKISPSIYSFFVDIGDLVSVKEFSENVIKNLGYPDVLVNCAGFATYQTFEEMSIEELERLVEVNFLGAIRCVHFFVKGMILRGHGSIVNVASIAGKIPLTPNGIYSASKHGMAAWTETLQYELAHFNINVAVVYPGRIETNFFNHETFKSRLPRAETRFTITVEDVSKKIISAIVKKKRKVYVPQYYSWMVWAFNALNVFIAPVYGKLLKDRIEDMYLSDKNKSSK